MSLQKTTEDKVVAQKKYSLQIAISTLFIGITVLLGVILSWQSFNKTSDIMLSSALELYQQETQEFTLDFKVRYGPVIAGLRQFRLSPISKAKTFEERIIYLPSFKAVLETESSIFAAGIGYKNGDYFGVSLVESDYVREKYTIPDGSKFIVLYIKSEFSEEGFSAGKHYTIFYDENLNEIKRQSNGDTAFDPRLRPWYQQAKEKPGATKPYIFYDSSIVGLAAMSKTTEPGSVVVFDITLKNLSETIAKYQLTPSSEVVLINTDGEVFAYKDQQKIIVKNSSSANQTEIQLANLKQLDSDVLAHVGSFLTAKEQYLDFEFKGKRWIGSINVIAKPGGVDLYALMLSPVEELLVDAIAIRNQLITAALIVMSIFIPVIWFAAAKISTPLRMLSNEAEAVSRFNFDKTEHKQSQIKEVYELDSAMSLMKSTINKFIRLINSLAGEQDLDVLLKSITKETIQICNSDTALIYLMDEQDDLFKASFLYNKKEEQFSDVDLPALSLVEAERLLAQGDENIKTCHRILQSTKDGKEFLSPLKTLLGVGELTSIVIPLQNRNKEIIGLLSFIYFDEKSVATLKNVEFVEALSGFAAVTLESRQLFNMQENLLHAFIKLIAGAIDAKSPYTAGHCQRVPEITLMLAKAACASEDEKFKEFDLDEKQWEELSIACWLHDCGKVTTPEYIVDKATKLETIYDRIHEVRTRFEVLKRDAEITCWQQIAEGGDKTSLLNNLKKECQQLDDDFAFVAECNIGGEFMAEDKIDRLRSIAAKTWQRTLDDNLGLSWEERERKANASNEDVQLPVKEKLLADKVEHIIARHESDKIAKDNPWGFNVDAPEHKYNRGELYNLSVQRGTLSEEERYMINAHMIETIKMLNNLPYPKALRDVPLIAGSHHETMDGKGYPKGLVMSEQPLTSRMMVIADIFEALTASDRPYKKAKTLSESLRILSFMRNDKHVDADLFELFLRSGVYLEYAKKFLLPEQIDEVIVEDYLA